MNRRRFLAALLGLPLAAKLASALKPTGNLFNPTANVAAQQDALVLNLDEFVRRYIDPAARSIVNQIDSIDWAAIENEPPIQTRFDPARLPA